jgi:NADPH2:quinone reductase
MKAAVYYQNGGPEVFKYEDVPDPECHPKGVVIRVEAVSIEGGDTLNRWHGALLSKPHVVGYQAGGEIVQIGSEVTDLKVGQKVTTVFGAGSHAALRAVPLRAMRGRCRKDSISSWLRPSLCRLAPPTIACSSSGI